MRAYYDPKCTFARTATPHKDAALAGIGTAIAVVFGGPKLLSIAPGLQIAWTVAFAVFLLISVFCWISADRRSARGAFGFGATVTTIGLFIVGMLCLAAPFAAKG